MLSSVQANVTDHNTVSASVIALLAGIKDELDEAIASNDMPALQALSESLAHPELVEWVVANTPAAMDGLDPGTSVMPPMHTAIVEPGQHQHTRRSDFVMIGEYAEEQHTPKNTALVFSSHDGNAITGSDGGDGTSNVGISLLADHGLLSLPSMDVNGLAFTTGNGSPNAVQTFSGSVNDINAALDGMVFMPETDYVGEATVRIQTSDLGANETGVPVTSTKVVGILVGG